MKKQIILLVSSILLTACNGGGSGSSGSTDPTVQTLPLNYQVSSSSMTGEKINGINVIDARPFASKPEIVITITNPYSNYDLTNLYLVPSITKSDDFNYENRTGYEIGTGSSTGGTCESISRDNPLLPGNSCTIQFTTVEPLNYTNSEDIKMLFNWGYEMVAMNSKLNYTNVHGSSSSQTLPLISIPYKLGIWYTNGTNYNFNGSSEAVMNVTMESGNDYMYLSSGQKIKVTFQNGVANIDFSNTVPCLNQGCSNGLIPSNFLMVQPYSPWSVLSGSLNYGINNVVWGLNNKAYGRTGQSSTDISMIYAVQPDGTIFGQNKNGAFGCFSNDGSNFRVIESQPQDTTFLYSNTSAQDYLYYGQTNWVYLEGTNNQGFYKLIADNTGKCKIDMNNVLDTNIVFLASQSYQTGVPSGVQQPVQITNNGVYSLYRVAGENPTSKLMFYKYPPKQE